MADIILCILASAALIVIFKLVERFRINLFPVIVVNYLVAVLFCMAVTGIIPGADIASQSWFGFALMLGILFVTIFTTIGLSTQRSGITVTAIAQKMSLAIPITAAFFLYNDNVTASKIAGVCMALAAIVLTTYKKKEVAMEPALGVEAAEPKPRDAFAVLLPVTVFVGSGICDLGINYVQKVHLPGQPHDLFIIMLFGTAFLAGFTGLLITRFRGQYSMGWKEVAAGIGLGVPNYFSLYFLLRSLEHSGLESSAVYPIINIGVVTTSALVAYVIFREKLGIINLLGIGLAIAAIAVLSLG